jgi:hypothetical protein
MTNSMINYPKQERKKYYHMNRKSVGGVVKGVDFSKARMIHQRMYLGFHSNILSAVNGLLLNPTTP